MKIFERNNKNIGLNILSALPNEKKNLTYKTDHNCKRKNQVVLSMVTGNEQEYMPDKSHYLALKSMPTIENYKKPIQSIWRLFRGMTSNHDGDFYF